jgi:rhomboid protease GluP
LNRLFLPLVALVAAVGIGCSLLTFLLMAAADFIRIDDDVVFFLLPLIVAAASVYTLIYPRFRPLKLSEKRDTAVLYGLAAVAVVAVPTIIAQLYLKDEVGGVTRVRSASEIGALPLSKFYLAGEVCLAKDNPAVRATRHLTGRGGHTLQFKLYVAVRVCETWGRNQVWIALTYDKSVASRVADPEGEYRKFAEDSERQLAALDPKTFRYLEQIGNNSKRRNFEKAIAESGALVSARPLILIPHTEPFEPGSHNGLIWAFGALGIGACIWLLLLAIPAVDFAKVRTMKRALRLRRARNRLFARMFVLPTRESYGLPLLIDLNILVFLTMVFSGLGVEFFETDDLVEWGALYGPHVQGAGIFRLITSQFVHAGLTHLVTNLYGLVFAGVFLHGVIGNWRLIACYLICGVAGAIASLFFHPMTVSVGASGAIMGLCGLLLGLVALRDPRVVDNGPIILINIGIVVGLTLLHGFLARGIDNAAHVAGLVCGVVLGIAVSLIGARDRAPPSEHA